MEKPRLVARTGVPCSQDSESSRTLLERLEAENRQLRAMVVELMAQIRALMVQTRRLCDESQVRPAKILKGRPRDLSGTTLPSRAAAIFEPDKEAAMCRDRLTQDARFQEAMMDAIAAGTECCPTQISTAPGTVRPVTGNVRPD
jgi:hypothetical protein